MGWGRLLLLGNREVAFAAGADACSVCSACHSCWDDGRWIPAFARMTAWAQ